MPNKKLNARLYCNFIMYHPLLLECLECLTVSTRSALILSIPKIIDFIQNLIIFRHLSILHLFHFAATTLTTACQGRPTKSALSHLSYHRNYGFGSEHDPFSSLNYFTSLLSPHTNYLQDPFISTTPKIMDFTPSLIIFHHLNTSSLFSLSPNFAPGILGVSADNVCIQFSYSKNYKFGTTHDHFFAI